MLNNRTCPVNPQTVEFPSGRGRRMSVIRTWQSCYPLNVLLPKKNRGVNLTVIYIGRRLCLMQNTNERRHKHSCKQTLLLWSRNTFQTSGHTAKGNKKISKQRSQGALFTPVLKLKTNLSNPIQQSLLGVYGALFWGSRNKFRSRDQTSRKGGLQTIHSSHKLRLSFDLRKFLALFEPPRYNMIYNCETKL